MVQIKTVAVIGAGVSGLTASKACLEQGMAVTCFEMHDDIGGVWYYTEHLRSDEGATVYDFLITNTSREMMRYSDFMFPSHAAMFPRHQEYHAYLHAYADHFGVTKCVQLNTKVLSIKKSKDYSKSGRWMVESKRNGKDHAETKEFDALMLCCGYHRIPYVPDIPGLSGFKKEWSHAREFKTAAPFKGKRVLVIGNANFALDTATGISECAQQVYLSVGSGCWVVPRATQRITYETHLLRRCNFSYTGVLDRKWRAVSEDYFNHDFGGIRPNNGPIRHFPTINDDIAPRILSGKIKIVPRTVKFFTDGVELEDGTKLKDIDHVLFATGFKPDPKLLDIDTIINSYKRVFPVEDDKPTLALIGQLSSTGPVGPLTEMQSRFAAQVFAEKKKLPSKSIMAADAKRIQEKQEFYFGKGRSWVISLPLQDEIAKEIGVYPNFFRVFLRSPKIAFQTYFGPAFPAQYRLLGEGRSEKAWEELKNVWKHMSEGINHRKSPELEHESLWPLYQHILYIFAIFFLIVAIFVTFCC